MLSGSFNSDGLKFVLAKNIRKCCSFQLHYPDSPSQQMWHDILQVHVILIVTAFLFEMKFKSIKFKQDKGVGIGSMYALSLFDFFLIGYSFCSI
jgi:hypothetical protein